MTTTSETVKNIHCDQI